MFEIRQNTSHLRNSASYIDTLAETQELPSFRNLTQEYKNKTQDEPLISMAYNVPRPKPEFVEKTSSSGSLTSRVSLPPIHEMYSSFPSVKNLLPEGLQGANQETFSNDVTQYQRYWAASAINSQENPQEELSSNTAPVEDEILDQGIATSWEFIAENFPKEKTQTPLNYSSEYIYFDSDANLPIEEEALANFPIYVNEPNLLNESSPHEMHIAYHEENLVHQPESINKKTTQIGQSNAEKSKRTHAQNKKCKKTQPEKTIKKPRFRMSKDQRARLLNIYLKSPFITPEQEVEIAKETNLTEKQVKAWFINQRSTDRRKMKSL